MSGIFGTRPRGYFPKFHVLGRGTFLVPVEWVDGRPRADPVRERRPALAAWHPLPPEPARDDFDGPALAPRWLPPRGRPDDSWSLGRRPGWLTLTATGDSLDRPGHAFVGRRERHPERPMAARLDMGSGRAGLSVCLDEAHHYGRESAGDGERDGTHRSGAAFDWFEHSPPVVRRARAGPHRRVRPGPVVGGRSV
ncbi:hypothetical protein [Streptomyces sp. NPDC059631]|uniref:beta-xylosidase family glycoside hydrolase n=1 Tax=unclassified Streptomyces TaxID=2593676 RepID=UPI00369DADC7